MDKPILIYDLETTSDEKETARICQYSWELRDGLTGHLISADMQYVNPGIPIPPEVTAVHGITNKRVKNEPEFGYYAKGLANVFNRDVIICGYNNRSFDDFVLENEFRRAGLEINLAKKPNMDVFAAMKHFYSFSLEDVVRLLFEEDMENAHDAGADVSYTYMVLQELKRRNEGEFPSKADEINNFLYPGFVDREGKLRWNEDGQAEFTFGKLNGWSIEDAVMYEKGYLQWICKQDFPEDFKQICREALVGRYPVKDNASKVEG